MKTAWNKFGEVVDTVQILRCRLRLECAGDDSTFLLEVIKDEQTQIKVISKSLGEASDVVLKWQGFQWAA